MDPVTLLAVGTGSQVLSGIGKSSSQSQQLENQAKALEVQAAADRRDGAFQESQVRKQQDRAYGSVTAGAAGSGVDVSSGSIVDLIKENAYNIEMDAQQARYNAETSAASKEYQAQAARKAKPTGMQTLLGAAGTAAQGYAQYKMFQG